ncbi:hypothetical protein L6164_010245 [Bauhinia variegata]|uniref:Uncharacterized protein n=1 Tax=Bauhinia variegata TaxID=167791 RepID=A0ACB9PSX2_BAUVA|nr:hypothetical protein L6164_010245 [Bauhinia variegata]
MDSKIFCFATFPLLFLLLLFALQANADISLDTLVDPKTICESTSSPSYCEAVLPKQHGKLHDFGKFCLQKSLLQSRRFSDMVNFYLGGKSTLSEKTIRALNDCQFLSQLNVEYLNKCNEFASRATETLSDSEADYAQTLLSAILTNQQTCLEGLTTTASDLSIKNGLLGALSDDSKLHSLSLALFTNGWVQKKNAPILWDSEGVHPGFSNGRLPLKMSSKTRAIYDSVRGRRKLGDEDSVLISDIVVVSQDGSGNFTTINDAVAAAPINSNGTDGYYLIYIAEGVYEEYVSIPINKPYLIMIGDGINRTIITGNRSAGDGWTTFNSATFAVVAPNFVAVNITFRNTAGPSKFQAVAMRSGADMSTFYSCSFEGYQDTLYTHSLRQFYRECDIYGTIDFILGNAAVFLQKCNIYARLPLPGQFNPITAQARTDPNQNTGISIHNCTIKAADDLAPSVGTVKTYLGRPWRQYSRTVVMQSFLDSLIDPAGWSVWDEDFALSTLYYAEYDNSGPGSNTSGRVTWPGFHVINATDAANFTVVNFIQGNDWLLQTGVPYIRGLIATNKKGKVIDTGN